MGACYFCYTEDGTDAEEVFGKLCRNAEREYGDDMYNGTISEPPSDIFCGTLNSSG